MGGYIMHKAYELGGCKFTCKNRVLSNLFKAQMGAKAVFKNKRIRLAKKPYF